MYKTIPVGQLRLGMFIVEFRGSWMEHPFWRSKFLLSESADLERVRVSSIQEVCIDISKGCDVQDCAPPARLTAAPASAEARPQPAVVRADPCVPRNSMENELKRAAVLCRQSKQAVTSMFQEVRMGRAVNSETARALVAEISDSVTRHPGALISLARLKTADDYTYMHSVAVCALMVALGRQLGLQSAQIHQAGMAGLLHDVGKMAVPIEVLNKPGRLTDAEFAIVQSHPVQGFELLGQSGVDESVLDVCLHHHEKVDGSGYPKGLRSDQISILAKMGAVCDVYDAITSNRPYKNGWDPAESIRRMAEWAPGHFDPRVFQAFVKSVGIYPVGSLVRLASGRVGVVTEQGTGSLTLPQVKVFYSTTSQMRIPAQVVDLAARGCSDRIVGRENPDLWQFPDLQTLWIAGTEADSLSSGSQSPGFVRHAA